MLREVFSASVVTAVMTTVLPVHRASAADVSIDNFTFSPAEITIRSGEIINFVNHDDIPHSVVGKGGKFRSRTLDTDEKFVFTPTTSGEYAYFCGLHPHMTGKIIVTP